MVFLVAADTPAGAETQEGKKNASGVQAHMQISMKISAKSQHVVSMCRDGLITVSDSSSGMLLAACQDFTGGLTPLHTLVLAPSDASVAAAAWADRLVVFEAPWRPGKAVVKATYASPQVRAVTTICVFSWLVGAQQL